MQPGLAIYIHWPFCARLCPYCAFNVHLPQAGESAAMLPVFLREIAFWRAQLGARDLASIFFGGGTPSLMAPEWVQTLLAALAKAGWRFAPEIEITLEANPEQIERDRLKAWRKAGVNRLSLGIQSFEDQSLRALGRRHRAADAHRALRIAQEAGFRTSFDLIYALPEQSLAGWRQELWRALDKAAGHISLYQLEFEPGSAFYRAAKRGKLNPLSPDEAAEFYSATAEITAAAGYPAYEVSNHAHEKEICRHNLACWRGGEYLGLGPGAHGRLGGRPVDHSVDHSGERIRQESRWQACENIKAPARWREAVAAGRGGLARARALSHRERLEEKLLTGLRLAEGIPLAGENAPGFIFPRDLLDFLATQNLVEILPSRLRATLQGWLVLDQLTLRLAEEMAFDSGSGRG